MPLVVESVCAEIICAHAQDSSQQHSFGPPSGIELLTLFSRTALHASLLARPLHNLHTSITQLGDLYADRLKSTVCLRPECEVVAQPFRIESEEKVV